MAWHRSRTPAPTTWPGRCATLDGRTQARACRVRKRRTTSAASHLVGTARVSAAPPAGINPVSNGLAGRSDAPDWRAYGGPAHRGVAWRCDAGSACVAGAVLVVAPHASRAGLSAFTVSRA